MRFEFGLARDTPGWADPSIEVDGDVLRMCASYLTDALGDLLNALLKLLNGSPDASCRWTQEPADWEWRFDRPNEDDITLRIRFVRDGFRAPPQRFSDEDARLTVHAPLVDIVQAIAGGARRCLDEVGPSGFAEQWMESPFPGLQLETLERWLATDRRAPRYLFEE